MLPIGSLFKVYTEYKLYYKEIMVKLKKIEAIKKLKQTKMIKLSPENLRDVLYSEPGVYAIYNGPDAKQRPLYVGSTKELDRRFGQLVETVYFFHTFTERLFWREAEQMSGRKYTNKELYDQFWFGNKKDREEIIMKIERLFNKLWFKYVELLDWEKDEYEELEKEVQKDLKPLNPHLRDSKITLDDLLR